MNRDRRIIRRWLETGDLRVPKDVWEAINRATCETRRPRKTLAPGRMKPDRKTKAEARRSTRPLVEERAGGVCEVRALGGCRGRLVWDHFWGRGKVPPSVEAEWMICEEHDHRKTENVPSRAWWISVFRIHCGLLGYAEQVAKCDAALALEDAQHPAERTGT